MPLVGEATAIDRNAGKDIQQSLKVWIARLEEIKNEAAFWKKTKPNRRNKLALKNATNNWNKAKGIRIYYSGKGAKVVANKLLNFYMHTKYWAERFRKWGGFDNGYAQSVFEQ